MPNEKLQQYYANRRMQQAEERAKNGDPFSAFFAVQRQRREEQKLKHQEELAQAEQQRIANMNFWERAGQTIADSFVEVGKGIYGGIEGTIDGHAALIGLFGDKDFKQSMRDYVSKDHLGNSFLADWDRSLDGSYIKDGGMVQGVHEGLEQMSLGMALSAIPYAGAGLSMGYFMSSAAGRATQEAWENEDTGYGQGAIYGMLSGGAEGLIEQVSGPVGGQFASKLGIKSAKTALGKVVSNFVGEGLEEVAADLIDPALKRATGVDKNASVDWGELPKTFLVGGATGAIAGALPNANGGSINSGYSNTNLIADNIQEARTLERKMDTLSNQGKDYSRTESELNSTLESINKNLSKMDASKRAKLIEKLGLQNDSLFKGLEGVQTALKSGEGKSVAEKNAPTAEVLAGRNRANLTASLQNRTIEFEPTQEARSKGASMAWNTISKLKSNAKMVITDESQMGDADCKLNCRTF